MREPTLIGGECSTEPGNGIAQKHAIRQAPRARGRDTLGGNAGSLRAARKAAHMANRYSGAMSASRYSRSSSFVFTLLLVSAAPAGAAPSASAEGRHGMVVSAQHEASAVGARILEAGGNAIDAAVAVGYALAVVDPCCGNIGGGGFMLIRRANGRKTVIDFRETAPRAATATMYLDPAGNPVREKSLYGYLA